MDIKVSASLLSADFCNLESEIKKSEQSGIDMIHFDVMDGVFVPNISFGVPVLKSIKKCTSLVYDVHLMITDPLKYINSFADAGADIITFHYESQSDVDKTIDAIHSKGLKAGLSVKPGTEIEKIEKYLEKLDMVLVMTVEPGFGGQSFMESMIEKIKKLKKMIDSKHLETDIEVDGGINAVTGKEVKEAGANVLVAGSYLFGSEDMKKSVNDLR